MSETRELKAVYFVGMETIDEFSYGVQLLPEDEKFLDRVKRKGFDPDRPSRNMEGSMALSFGVPIENLKVLPSRVILEGPKRPIADFRKVFEVFLVRDNFKEIVERLEPNVHQFMPVELTWSDGTLVEGDYYWFVVAQALDSVNQEHTTAPLRYLHNKILDKKIRAVWRTEDRETFEPYTFVFDQKVIGGAHVWQDEYMVVGPYCSDVFKAECEAEGIVGISITHSHKVV